MYIVVAHVLSCTLIDDVDQGLIKGVHLSEIGEEYTHYQFANDTKIITVATKEYVDSNVDNTFDLFRTSWEASGLFGKETRVKAFLISQDPLPQEL